MVIVVIIVFFLVVAIVVVAVVVVVVIVVVIIIIVIVVVVIVHVVVVVFVVFTVVVVFLFLSLRSCRILHRSLAATWMQHFFITPHPVSEPQHLCRKVSLWTYSDHWPSLSETSSGRKYCNTASSICLYAKVPAQSLLLRLPFICTFHTWWENQEQKNQAEKVVCLGHLDNSALKKPIIIAGLLQQDYQSCPKTTIYTAQALFAQDSAKSTQA